LAFLSYSFHDFPKNIFMAGIFKRKWVKYVIILLVIGGIGSYFYFSGGEEPEYVLEEAVIGDIVQTVSVTGSIKVEPTIDLHFQKNGTVNDILVDEGELVEKGDVLATLENEFLELEIKRNRANVDYASAQYNQLKAGSTSEEVRIAEAEVESAQAAYEAALTEQENTKAIGEQNIELAQLAYEQAQDNVDAAERDYETTKELAENEIAKLELGGDNTQTVALKSAYVKARTSLGNVITAMQDGMFLAEDIIGVRGTGFFLLSQSDKNSLERNYYLSAEEDYQDALDAYNELTLDATDEDIDKAVEIILKAGNAVSVLLTQVGIELQNLPYSRDDLDALILEVSNQYSALSASLNGLQEIQSTILNIKTGSSQDTETLILNYQLQIDAAENKYMTAVNALEKAEYDLDQAKVNAENSNKNAAAQVTIRETALTSAKANLDLRRAPVRQTDLAPLAAQISLANVALEIAQNEYKDSQLIAPIDGRVTFIHGQVGENVSLSETALKSFLTIQADNILVEANVPETDVNKVQPGDKIVMTVDAFDFTDKFEGSVVYIDPAETVIQGVVYYQIKAQFDLDDERLKSGMTTNLDIITEEKSDVLIIPTRAIKYEDSIRYVEALRNGKPEKVIITTGVESDQYAEVTSGLNEGDKIITFVK